MTESLPESLLGQMISHYRVERIIGRGGMGVVFAARDLKLQRTVAIKFATPPSASPEAQHEFRDRFAREARLAAALTHPNIARIYEFGETPDGQPYLVMEYIAGRSLQEALQEGALSLTERLDIILAVADALGEAHRHGILHRDIKPGNILLDEKNQPKVLDFGLAKQLTRTDEPAPDAYAPTLASTHTRNQMLLGTPNYMSPEQIEYPGDETKLDGRSDLFSLGVVLYQCLTNHLPFPGKEPATIIAQVLRDEPISPEQLNPQISATLAEFTRKSLAKKREARFEHAAAFIEALQTARATVPPENGAAPAIEAAQPSPAKSSLVIPLPTRQKSMIAAACLTTLCAAWFVWWRQPETAYHPPLTAVEFYQTGLEALHDGAYLAAENSFAAATQADPNFALAWARRAEAQFEMDLQQKASDHILQATARASRHKLSRPQRLELEAIQQTLLRDHLRAAEHWRERSTLVDDTMQLSAWLDLGRALDRANRTTDALAIYQQALALTPQAAAVNLRLGILHIRRKDFSPAEAALQRAEINYQHLGKLEGEATVSYWRGVMWQGRSDFAHARDALQTALAKAQSLNNRYRYFLTLIQRGTLENDERQYEAAEQTLRTAVSESRATANLADWARINLANCLRQQKKPTDAAALYQRAIDSATELRTPYNLALAQVNLASLLQPQKPDEALPLAQAAFEFFQRGEYQGEMMRTTQLLARLHREKAQFDAALQVLDKPLQLTRTNAEYANTASLLLEQARIESLRGDLPRALQRLSESRLAKTQANLPLQPYDLLDQAKAAWQTGDFTQCAEALAALNATPNLSPEYQARSALTKAAAAWSRQDIPATLAALTPALQIADGETQPLARLLQANLQPPSGTRRANHLRGDGLQSALHNKGLDFQLSILWYAATAAVTAQDWLEAQQVLSQLAPLAERLSNFELQWRTAALAVQVNRAQRDFDGARRFSDKARQQLAQLRSQWGETQVQRYLARPDLKQLVERLL